MKIYRDYGAIELDVIETYEKEVTCKFPSNYKKLLSKHNALWPEQRNFNFYLNSDKQTKDVIFWGYGDSLKKSINIRRFQQGDYYHDHVVVIGGAAGGDYVCFDYRADPTTDNPPVVVMLHDYFDDNDNKMFVCPVADNFEQFIDSLYSADDEDE